MVDELIEETISAEDFRSAFLEWLKDDAAELPRHRTIDGDLDFGGLAVDRMLTLTDRVITGYLGLYDMQFARSVNLRGCKIGYALNLADSVVEGSLDISGAIIGCKENYDSGAVDDIRVWLAEVPDLPALASLRNALPRTITGLRSLVNRIDQHFTNPGTNHDDKAQTWWDRRPDAVDSWTKSTVAAWMNNLQVRGSATFSRTTFCGNVSINSTKTGGNLNLTGIRLRGWLDGSGASIGGGINLANSTIEGNCSLESASAQSHIIFRYAKLEAALNLCAVRSGASVLADGIQCQETNLEDLKAEGDLSFQGANIAGFLKAMSMRISGRASFDCRDTARTNIRLGADLAHSEFALGLSMKGAHFGSALGLRDIRAKFVDLDATPEFITRIHGFLSVDDADITGDVRMRGTNIRNDAHFSQGRLGALFFSPAAIRDGDANWSLARPRVQSFHAIGLQVRGMAALIGVEVGSESTQGASTDPGGTVDLRMSSLGGIFTWSGQFIDEAASAAVGGGEELPKIDVRHEEIGLRATQFRMDGATSAFVHLDNALVVADSKCPTSGNKGLASFSDCRIAGDFTWVNHTGNPESVGCRQLDATALRCDGDVNLSGVYTTVCPDENTPRPKAISLRDAQIHGQLRLHTSSEENAAYSGQAHDAGSLTAMPVENIESTADSGEKDEATGIETGKGAAHANLSGTLRLDAAAVGHLIIGGESFSRLDKPCESSRPIWKEFVQIVSCNLVCRPDPAQDPDAIISVERATIRRVEIRDPLPAPVDLTRVAVERWELPPPKDDIAASMSQEERVAFPFLKLLSCASPFKRSNYAMIDRSLRDRGENAASDAVFRAMKFELLRRERRWLRQLGGLLHAFIGFGTQWKAMVLLLIAMALGSVGIFTLDGGIEIRPETKGALVEGGQDPSLARWNADEWSLSRRIGAASALTLRYHVPLISLPAFEGFRAGPGLPMIWATSMAALHWVLLPLILSSLIPSIIRRRDDA